MRWAADRPTDKICQRGRADHASQTLTAIRRFMKLWCVLARGNEKFTSSVCGFQGELRKKRTPVIWPMRPSRYTEVRLEKISAELFRDIGKDTVDFVPNYDNTTTEPVLFSNDLSGYSG